MLAEQRTAYPAEYLWKGGYEHLASRYSFTPQYFNPFLRQVFAADQPSILDISSQLCNAFADGFHAANVFIITLGLIEAWIDIASGLYINNPGGLLDLSQERRIRLHQMSYDKSLNSLHKIISIIRRNRPESVIIFTVSPVFLARTFSGQSIAEAALYGKSLLRAAVAAVVNPTENIFYFPSYEYVLCHAGHESDGRHVQSSYVENVVATFVDAFLSN